MTIPEWVDVTTVTKPVEWVEKHEVASQELNVTNVVCCVECLGASDVECTEETGVVEEPCGAEAGVVSLDLPTIGVVPTDVVTCEVEPVDDDDSVDVNGQ